MATAAVIPAGGTFVDTLKKSFVDVTVDADQNNAINTSEFLEAAESLTTIFGILCLCLASISLIPSSTLLKLTFRATCLDLLGSVAFTPVKNDMLGNIKVQEPFLPSYPRRDATVT